MHTALHVSHTRVSPYLDGILLPETIAVTAGLEQALDGAGLVFLVVPSQAVRMVARRCAPLLAPDACVLLCSKGIERETGLLMSEVAGQELQGRPLAVLSGPSFAAEVAAGKPAAVTVAISAQPGGGLHASRRLGVRLETALDRPSFRIHLSGDPIGVEIAGAMKNVIAIACGIAAGMDLGANLRAALITRGLAEMRRLTVAAGGHPETATGLAGIGDLVLTCSDPQSRNYSLGHSLGSGQNQGSMLAEGAVNAGAVAAMAQRHGLDLPVCRFVDGALRHPAGIREALETLLAS